MALALAGCGDDGSTYDDEGNALYGLFLGGLVLIGILLAALVALFLTAAALLAVAVTVVHVVRRRR